MKLKAILFSLFISGAVFQNLAQETHIINLNDALSMAIENSPLLKNDDLSASINQLQKKKSWKTNPLSLTYEQGQLNSAGTDYIFSAHQDLGSPVSTVSERKYYESRSNLLKKQKLNNESNIKQTIYSNYYEYLYLKENIKNLEELYGYYQNLANIAALKYESGESNLLSKINADLKAEQLHHDIEHLKAELKVVLQSFNRWLFSDSLYIPEEKKSIKMQLPENIETRINSVDNNSFRMVLEEESKLAKQKVGLQKSKFGPGFSVGYFNQQIDDLKGLQGVSVGVQIPILFFNYQKDVKIAEIDYMMAQNALENYDNYLRSYLDSKIVLLTMYNDKIEHYEDHMVNRANSIIKSSETLYQNGEITYLEYLNNLENAINLNIHYYELINQYNQTLIEIIFAI